MKILVTGGNGQLAKCIRDTAAIYDKVNEYVFLGRGDLDITDSKSICSVFDTIKPQIVLNCAAYVKTDEAEGKNRLNAYMVNALGPTYLALACKERDIELIHISTDYVFDGEKPTAYSVDDECNPLNIYGVSKYCGEEAIKTIYPEAIIIRTSWLYSEYGDNFLTKTVGNIKNAISEGKKLKYVVDQIGCPTYAMNLAHFIVINLIVEQQDAKIRKRTVYHYTDDGIASRYDFAKEIEKGIFNRSDIIEGCETSEFSDKAKRPKCCILSKREILDDFKCYIMNWRDALHECVRWFDNDTTEEKKESGS